MKIQLTILGEVEKRVILVGETNDLIWLAIQRSAHSAALDVSSVVKIEDEHFLTSFADNVEVIIPAIDAFAIGEMPLRRSLAPLQVLCPAKFAFCGVDDKKCHNSRRSKDGTVIFVLNRPPPRRETSEFAVFLIWGKHNRRNIRSEDQTKGRETMEIEISLCFSLSVTFKKLTVGDKESGFPLLSVIIRHALVISAEASQYRLVCGFSSKGVGLPGVVSRHGHRKE